MKFLKWANSGFRKFLRNTKAIGKNIVGAIVGLSVALYVAASILPSAIVEITNETSWSGAPQVVVTLGTTVIGIVAVVAIIMMLLRRK